MIKPLKNKDQNTLKLVHGKCYLEEDVRSAVEYRKGWEPFFKPLPYFQECHNCGRALHIYFRKKDIPISLCSVCVEEYCYPDLFIEKGVELENIRSRCIETCGSSSSNRTDDDEVSS